MTIDATVSSDELDAIIQINRLREAHSALVEAREALSTVYLGPGNVIRGSLTDAISATQTVLMGKIGTVRRERGIDP